MSLYEKLLARQEALAVVGLGYVGMPIAVEFSKHVNVIGYDVSAEKIAAYRAGFDPTHEVGDDAVASAAIDWTSDPARLKDARFIIVAVPTPVKHETLPDLSMLASASATVGKNLAKGSLVVYESTVYPGTTEEVCIPILERESGLVCGVDFKVGYSPERINPGDKLHRLDSITKVVSAMDAESLEEVANVYGIVVGAGVYRAGSIQVAEAAKVIENSQRDINIAFMNELSIIFNRMGIDTLEVLEAAKTKWNFLPFTPGLVGGHCIGIDPYYLTYRAEQFGYHSQVILSGRRINDGMGKYVAEQTVKQLVAAGIHHPHVRVGCLGITFKENCPDVRNTKVFDILAELKEYGIEALVCDPVADAASAKELYGLDLLPIEQLTDLDCVIVAVAHDAFVHLSPEAFDAMFGDVAAGQRVVIDVKGIRDKSDLVARGYRYWRL